MHSKAPALTLFADEASPPVRFVQMTASMLSVPMKIHDIDLFKGENRTEFYKKVLTLLTNDLKKFLKLRWKLVLKLLPWSVLTSWLTVTIFIDLPNLHTFQINPLLKVPALQVDDHIITDSHAIALYLCQEFGGHMLYPQDVIIRSRVHQMMFFNASTLFPIDSAIFVCILAKLLYSEIANWWIAGNIS